MVVVAVGIVVVYRPTSICSTVDGVAVSVDSTVVTIVITLVGLVTPTVVVVIMVGVITVVTIAVAAINVTAVITTIIGRRIRSTIVTAVGVDSTITTAVGVDSTIVALNTSMTSLLFWGKCTMCKCYFLYFCGEFHIGNHIVLTYGGFDLDA